MKPLFLLLVCAALTACHSPSIRYIPLTATALYNSDSVRFAMEGGDEKAANNMLTTAMDRYRKSRDTTGSIALIKAAILVKPTARGYFELSGALLATRGYGEAVAALAIAEKMGYTPLANLMFRYSYAYASMESSLQNVGYGKTAENYMEIALQMGYAHPEEFLRKEYFPKMEGYSDFTKVFNETLGGMAGRNPEKSLWESYATQFPETPLPLVLNLDWIKAHPLTDDISFEFERFIPEMRTAKFERDGGEVYYYVALVKKDPAYTTVVYGASYEGPDEPDLDSANLASGAVSTLTPLFYLASYDPHGKLIDKMLVAGRNDLTKPLKAFSLGADMHFQVQDLANEFKESAGEAGHDSSSFVGLKAQPPVNYLIDAAGKFIPTATPLAVR